MDYQKTGTEILDHIGGARNVALLSHCSTRLRFNLVDDEQVDVEALRGIPGVMGVVKGPQTQVIIGPQVTQVHDAVQRRLGDDGDRPGPAGRERPRLTWKRVDAVVMDFIVSVFVPIIPAIAGAGILKSLLILVGTLGWMDAESDTYLALAAIPDAVFGFLPILVSYTAARKLELNRPVAIGISAVLIFPAFSELVGREGGLSLFGLPVTAVNYSAQVFPSILAVLLLWPVERLFNRITPGPIRTFFVPLMCFLIVVPATILALGPLGYGLGTLLLSGMLALHDALGWFAVALLATVLPFIIAIGMHKVFLPPTINQVSTTGADSLYLPASLAHNLSESGATLAVALRTRDQSLRATAISAGTSAFFGITEPALYGVTLQNRRTLISVLIGAFAGGSWVGLTHVSALAVVSPGVASLSMFVNAEDPGNIVNACIGFGVAFVVAFVASLLLWRDSASGTLRAGGGAGAPGVGVGGADDAAASAGSPEETSTGSPASAEGREQATVADVASPLAGRAVPLSEVPDPVFSQGVLGEGIAIEPEDGVVVSPVAGTVITLMDSRHAVGIRDRDGAEILIHVGLDTVTLKGAPFTAHVAPGDRVEVGQPLLDADLAAIEAAGLRTITPVVVLNSRGRSLSHPRTGPTRRGDQLFTITTPTTSQETTHDTAR